jgi:citrate synthase
MGMLCASVSALSTFYPEAKHVMDRDIRRAQMVRLIAKMPTLAAWSYRHAMGMPFVYPSNELSYSANFLQMIKRIAEPKFEVHPEIVRALDVRFILHADHEQNCSTHAMRGIGSSHVDPYSALAGAVAALYGPLHGGANEAVLRMLKEIGSLQNFPDFIKRVKAGKGKLMGFGHRVYKSYDPRAKIIKRVADEVFEVTGKNPLLDIALKLEEVALADEYFTEAIGKAQESWRFAVAQATFAGIPVPGFSSALAYYDGLRSERLPAALIQGQRDFFGAHTYHRVDDEGAFHTLWSADRSEIAAD